MKSVRKALLFTLALLPIGAVGGWFAGLYQFEMYDPAILEEAVAQIGSRELLMAIVAVQSVGYTAFCGFIGYLLAEKTGLMQPVRFELPKLVRAVLLSAAAGILFSLDYWTFGAWIPGIRESSAAGMTLNGWIASVLYGGVIEEVMLRLFTMSLIAWLLWKLFFRKCEHAPVGVIITANVIAALLFAAGHLPATVMLFGQLTPLILLRCFLLNGGFGLLFGELYRRYGIQYAMVSHALLHIVSKTIWMLFI